MPSQTVDISDVPFPLADNCRIRSLSAWSKSSARISCAASGENVGAFGRRMRFRIDTSLLPAWVTCMVTLHLGPAFDVAGLVNLLHDGIPIGIVRQSSRGAQDAFAPLPCWRNHLDLDLDLQTIRNAEVLVEFNGVAVHFAVNDFGHRLPVHLSS